MFCDKAHTLIKELDRNRDILPPYNNDLVNEIGKEITTLIEQNQIDAQTNETRNSEGVSLMPTIRVRHAAIHRNLRCILAYHYNRLNSLRTMRWEFGSILPVEIKVNLSTAESNWFAKYSSTLAKYMRSLGEDGGVNLAVDMKPPKALYIEVRCMVDYGRFELSDGSVLLLKKNSRHYLPRCECEELILTRCISTYCELE
ncbi:partner of sld5 [Holotrichia oblita]|uniref:Partner of sld5 n=1 Tax=Holotrichia oblita TaxID=644536 RepID=A0ACB9T2Q2_HOLOL|nr:partner of sld5 [Holotrichia oblita]